VTTDALPQEASINIDMNGAQRPRAIGVKCGSGGLAGSAAGGG